MPARRSSKTETPLRASVTPIRARRVRRPEHDFTRGRLPCRQWKAHRACVPRKQIRPPAPRREYGRRGQAGTPPAAPQERGISNCEAIKIRKVTTSARKLADGEPGVPALLPGAKDGRGRPSLHRGTQSRLLHLSAHRHVAELLPIEDQGRAFLKFARLFNIDCFDRFLSQLHLSDGDGPIR